METSFTFTERFAEILRGWAEVFMRRSMRDFMELSRQSGLSMSQMGTMFRLYHTGFCGVSDIGDHLGITHAAASQMVDRLVQLGFLARTEDLDDRRVKKITLTPKGRKLVDESIEARRRWIEQLTDKLPVEQLESISAALVALTDAARMLEKQDSISETV